MSLIILIVKKIFITLKKLFFANFIRKNIFRTIFILALINKKVFSKNQTFSSLF